MNKRKRDEREPPKRANPPVPALQDSSDDFLVHVLNVSEFATSKSSPDESQLKSLGCLLKALEEERAMPGCPVSEKDVSLLLLPWAVRNILSGTNLSRWTWHSLFVSLNTIVNSNDSYAMYSLSSQVLTQSTLFKLCPKIALFVASSSDNHVSTGTENDAFAKSYAAKAYVAITEKLFNPTMDVACKSLLLVILGEESHPSPVYHTVLMATVKLIHRLIIHGKGNPKTTFQLLSSDSILIALSKVHSYFRTREYADAAVSDQGLLLTKEIFSFGLFHPTHHLQGFYSLLHKMKTAPFSKNSAMTNQKDKELGSFRCYQEELLVTVEQTLSFTGTHKDADDKKSKDVVSVIHAMSILFQVLLEQKWEERGEHSSRKKSQVIDSVNMHFQMFARWMVRLQQIVETGDEHLRSAALQSMLEMLESLLEYNAYSASQDDSGGYFFGFLAGIYDQIVLTSTATWDKHSLACTIPILKVLLRLNHRLVHDSLGKLIIRSLEIGVIGNENHASDILVEVFSTYEKLRQQSYVIGEILNALNSLREAGKNVEANFVLDLLNTEKVRLAVSQALSSCPILLVKEVFILFEEWFTHAVSEKQKISQTGEMCLCVAADLVGILSQSAIVDKSTASNIAAMCEPFMENVVSNLTAFMTGCSGSLKHILADLLSSMCAWIIDLHIRCTFWLGRHFNLAIPGLLSEHLSSFRYLQPNTSSDFNGIFNGVALLACNRLTQIDTEIHDEERKTIDSQDKAKDIEYLILEGKELASSIFVMGSTWDCADSRQNRHPWCIIAKHCFQWLQFAHDNHISEFLRWVCKTSLLPTLDYIQDPALTTAICAKVDLLRDSRFMEHDLIYKRLFPETLRAAIDLIKAEVALKGIENEGEAHGLVSVLNHPIEDDSIAYIFHYLQQKEGKFVIENPDDRLQRSSERALYLVREVAAPSVESRDTSYDDDETLHLLCKLDFAFRVLACSDKMSHLEWENTQCILRKTLSRQMQPILFESLQKNPKTSQKCLGIIETMFDSYAVIDQDDSNKDLSVVRNGIEHLVSCIAKALFDSRMAASLIVSIKNIIALATKRKDEYALVAFSRFISEGLRKYMDSDNYSSQEVTPLLKILWDVAQLRAKTDSVWNSPSGQRLRIEGMLLACDILKIDFNKTQFSQLLDEIILDKSADICNDTMAEQYAFQSRAYIIGFLAVSCTEKSLCKRLLDVVIEERKESSLLDASFINLIKHLTEDDTDELLQKLTDPTVQESRLRYLLLILQYATDEQVNVISKYSQTIFRLTTTQLNTASQKRGKPTCTSRLDLLLEIVDHLLRHRDVFIFREFDIAVILSHISAILGSREQHAGSKVAVSTFSWCATILVSMFQRYSKFLYACVPSVISLYSCLLSYAMFGPDERRVTQQFAGVCELIVAHKDVYKKHVLGIVLEFVWQLGILSLERRNQMLPAIYSLLDTMSTYELQQLNASMGTEQKVLFRTVYQAYQKGHTYKGQ